MSHDDVVGDHNEDRLRQRVELSLLPGIGRTTAIIEWQTRGTRFNEVHIASSWETARAWSEAHYEDVLWANDVRGSGLIGLLADDLELGGREDEP